MSIQRKEPVIDSRICDLTDRVKLTWRDVRDLAASSPVAPAESPAPMVREAEAASVADTAPAAESPRAGLTDEEKAALTAALAPAVEEAVRNALRETLEMSLQNALTRVRADIDRSVAGIVNESVSKALSRIDLNTLIRR